VDFGDHESGDSHDNSGDRIHDLASAASVVDDLNHIQYICLNHEKKFES
jgi:hypothetical protein